MHADLSRWIFRPERHYSRVVVQQGRVSLDADANAEASILLYYLRTLAADLIGEFGGPSDNLGFVITTGTDPAGKATLGIGPGHYYVDGLLCEADGTTSIDYYQQPDGYGAMPDLPDPALSGLAQGLGAVHLSGRGPGYSRDSARAERTRYHGASQDCVAGSRIAMATRCETPRKRAGVL